MEGHAKASFANGIHQSFGRPPLLIQESQIGHNGFAADIASVTRTINLQANRLHLHRRISEYIFSAPMPV
jgi:hypothetical protein